MADTAFKIASKNPLEQFLLLAKNIKGTAVGHLIKQVTEAPGVYVFGELMRLPNIKEIASCELEKEWNLLNLFAYGKYSNYTANVQNFPELSEAQVMKLRHLTIIELASINKHIPYSTLLQELGMKSVRQLEDLVIETIYVGILRGKLDQKRQQLEIEFVIGRDIKEETIDSIADVLEKWCKSCDEVLESLDKQISRSNSTKEHRLRLKKQIEEETGNLKKAIKAQSSEMPAEDNDSSALLYQNVQQQKLQQKHNKMLMSVLKPNLQSRGKSSRQ
ncbi:COP9 signalosome complex subunit 7b-like isoform X2 [Rhopilema esculentum]